jgi:glucosyl-dolichyl phosphate glucuronosyltransferase
MTDHLQVSIVICTHRRFNLVRLAIESLCHQTAPKEMFEVIVVDNDISTNCQVINIVNEAKGEINIRYLHEPEIGLSNARNSGGKAAFSQYVGYMDDDAKLSDNYIEILLQLIGTNQFDIIGGPYYAFYLTQKPFWFQDKYESVDSGDSHLFQNHEFLHGTNMVYKKSLLEEANWFNVSYGMSGKMMAYGEETDMQIRLWKKRENLKVFYSSDLIVFHLVPEYKMKLFYKFMRSYNVGKSHAYMWISKESIVNAQKKAPFILIKTICYLILKVIPKFLFRDKTKYIYWQNYVYEVIARYFTGVGQEWARTKDLFFK